MMLPIRLLFLLLLSGLSACSLLPPAEPVAFYRLPPSTLAQSSGPIVKLTLRVTRPEASGLLAGTRIAVIPQDNQFSAYQGGRWVSPVPVLWRDQLTDAFLQDGRLRHVSNDNGGPQADIELGGELRAFQSEYRHGAPVVVIRFDARLVDVDRQRILASRRFELSEPVQGTRLPLVVAAFGRAHDRLSRQLIDWTLAQLAP